MGDGSGETLSLFLTGNTIKKKEVSYWSMFSKRIALLAFCAMISLYAELPAQEYAAQSRLASGLWYKIPVSATGVYKITTSQVETLAQVPCTSIQLYGSEGKMLAMSNSTAQPDDLESVAIEIIDIDHDGIFDNEDYLLFYGEAPDTWRYVADDDLFEYNVHAYANYNFYYLTTGENTTDNQRVQQSTAQPDNPLEVVTHTATALYHENRINTHGGGQIWVADKYTPSLSSRSYSLTLPSSPTDGTVDIRYAFASISTSCAQLNVTAANSSFQHDFPNSTTYNIYHKKANGVSSNTISLKYTYEPRESNAAGYLDFIELNATVPLSYSGGQQTIRNKSHLSQSQQLQFVVSGSGEGVRVWDITNPLQPVSNPVTKATNRFSFLSSSNKARSFILFTDSDALIPEGIAALPNQDIHGAATPDYVIVCHHDYIEQAERLAMLHRQLDGMSVMVVTQEQVFNEFSSGKQDPMAIRQMLRCMRSKAPEGTLKPSHLLLFGKGTYDNRDYLGAHQTTAVTYQTPSSFDSEGSAYPSDDVYGYLSDNTSGPFDNEMTVSIGRIPAKTVAEATHIVDKIEGYMTRKDLTHDEIRGDWRNYVALLADDADPSSPYDTNFASDSEIMARNIKQLYPHFNIDRIYADAYPQQSGADGSYYPDVNNALRQRMNYGCLLLNYIGHGSSNYIGTERFMEFSDIDKYTNTDRLAFFVTSTCTFGKFDQVNDICGSEAFLLAEAAGVGIVSASRPIHHVQRFNADVCLFALNPANTIGDALRLAKNRTSVSHCIALIGDPALHLSHPRNEVVVTHINQMPVNPAVTDSALVLSRVTVDGEIRDPQGNVLTDFDGTIYPVVFDREIKCRTLANDNDSTEVDFVQQKSILYKGRETVTSGTFSYSFIVPRDVSYRFDYAKLSHYARNQATDATGAYTNIMFGGFNDDLVINEIHPDIRLFIGDTTFRNGGLTNETPTLYAQLFDSVGINAAGSGLGHDITAVIDGNPYSTVTLNDFFEPDITDSRKGEIRYTLGKLDEGRHTLTLKCWNIFNYSSSATIHFYVVNDRTPQIGRFDATPNPASDRTTLRVEHNLPYDITSATIDIFDIRGTLIRSVTPSTGSCVLNYQWDFTASNGCRVPRGIYIARISLTTSDGQLLTSTSKIVHN